MFHLVKSWGSLVSCHRANIGFDSDRMPNFRSRKLKTRTSLFFFQSYCLTVAQLKEEKHTVYKFQLFYIFLWVGSFYFLQWIARQIELLCWKKIVDLNEFNRIPYLKTYRKWSAQIGFCTILQHFLVIFWQTTLISFSKLSFFLNILRAKRVLILIGWELQDKKKLFFVSVYFNFVRKKMKFFES